MHAKMFISHLKYLYNIFSEIKSSIACSSQSMRLHAPSHSETGTKYYITTTPFTSWGQEVHAITKKIGPVVPTAVLLRIQGFCDVLLCHKVCVPQYLN
jgi:hypothetical protein